MQLRMTEKWPHTPNTVSISELLPAEMCISNSDLADYTQSLAALICRIEKYWGESRLIFQYWLPFDPAFSLWDIFSKMMNIYMNLHFVICLQNFGVSPYVLFVQQ